jgi:hypothetical protein
VNYRVTWDDKAIDQLQRIHDAAHDREAIIHAIHRIGLELADHPLQAGESRERGSRVLFKYPLVVQYRLKSRFDEIVIVDVRVLKR